MLVLGINGNFSPADTDVVPGLPGGFAHDSAACLVRDGVLVAAVEEERLNRIKKTTKFPTNAIRECLALAGATPQDVDAVAYYFPEDFVDAQLNQLFTQHPRVPVRYTRELITERLGADLGWHLDDGDLHFVNHHVAHAMSTFVRSGMDDALVVVMDGAGESNAITVYVSEGPDLREIASYPIAKSLGFMYLFGTQLLGYGFGDEYKVMGLAPYGDASTYREVFDSLYTLHGNGDYELAGGPGFNAIADAFRRHGIRPRRKGEPFSEQHMDIAAGLQEMTEQIAMHVLTYWADETGLRKLAFGGGVAHNSTLNGRILASDVFEEVFIHPASHDAGSAEGAALAVSWQLGHKPWPQPRMTTASLGPDLGATGDIELTLKEWQPLVEFEKLSDVVEETAQLLADGSVLGWAQGRSEFGPRALGNRSIIADARPKENQTRINAMVKKRESFRPFAPVVTPEAAAGQFDLPATRAAYDFMSFVVPVREDRRAELGAITHVDGSARVQIVAEQSNPRFHALITRFGEITGTSVLLNTSFNNNAEPIVQTVEDVLVSYLTTSLDYLVVDDFLVRRRDPMPVAVDDFVLEFRPVTRIRTMRDGATVRHEVTMEYADAPSSRISDDMAALLAKADGHTPLRDLGVELTAELREELFSLWQDRYFVLRPAR